MKINQKILKTFTLDVLDIVDLLGVKHPELLDYYTTLDVSITGFDAQSKLVFTIQIESSESPPAPKPEWQTFGTSDGPAYEPSGGEEDEEDEDEEALADDVLEMKLLSAVRSARGVVLDNDLADAVLSHLGYES